MKVSIEDVKRLREKTSAGIADCRMALEEAGGKMDEAIEILRKRDWKGRKRKGTGK